MRTMCYFCLFALLFGNVYAAVVYGATNGATGNNVVVSINISTGSFTEIAADSDTSGYSPGKSCFDQINKVFYYVTDLALYPVDVVKGTFLPLVKFGYSALVISCNVNVSNILVAIGDEYDSNFQLISYPLANDQEKFKPTVVAHLTKDDNISWADSQTYDPIHNMFYSIWPNGVSDGPSVLHRVNLSDPIHATHTLFPSLYFTFYCLKYDPFLGKTVGITSVANQTWYDFHAVVLEDDGTCTWNVALPGIDEITAATYDPFTSTFYISAISYEAVQLFIFDTKTSKTTSVDIPNILNYIEVAY